MTAPRVVSLHRYPVKSLLGERVGALDVDRRGVAGDRLWSVRTSAGKIGSGKSTRRFEAVPGLLGLRAATRNDRVVVELPGGMAYPVDDPAAAAAVSRHVGMPVTLAAETAVSHFDDGPVSLLGLASVAAVERERGEPVDPGRFRANVVLATAEPFVEEAWVGCEVTVGTAVLAVTMVSPRCVMVDLPTADLPPQPGVLGAVGRVNAARLGVVADVVVPGRMSVGDTLRVARA